jgi:hypothetical protein
VQAPDKALLLQQREKLAHKPKKWEQTTEYKKVYKKILGDEFNSSLPTKNVSLKK